MAKPRDVQTALRRTAIDVTKAILKKQLKKINEIISDLEKPHVDDKKAAKALLSEAVKLRNKLA